MLTLSIKIIAKTSLAENFYLERYVKQGEMEDQEELVHDRHLTDARLIEVAAVAEELGDKKVLRAVRAIQAARTGDFMPVPSFKAFESMLNAYLKQDLIKGWLFRRQDDGRLYPFLITSIHAVSGRQSSSSKPDPFVAINGEYYGHEEDMAKVARTSFVFRAGDVTNKRLPDILEADQLHKETEALHEEFEQDRRHFDELIAGQYGKQFRMNADGLVRLRRRSAEGVALKNRRVIHDLGTESLRPIKRETDTSILEAGIGEVPNHPVVRIFDLGSHDFHWVNGSFLEPYKYDKSLREKLILPPSHRDLLDVLTADLNAFTEDFIEGKKVGNIIICKGQPGVGKTLTAEVYSELTETPLYRIHAGTLGTSPDAVKRSLDLVFKRARKWGCALLLDEADVFVRKRGDDLQQNAIVAEFLRSMEYSAELLFMTTNRADDIDDAMIQRAAAVIQYDAPTPDLVRKMWQVQAKNFDIEIDDKLMGQLESLFPQIVPRDMKHLIRLVLRHKAANLGQLDIDTFRRVAMFRAVKMNDSFCEGLQK